MTHPIDKGGKIHSIMKTCPCNEQPPYTPILYRKTGVYRGMHFFLFLI